MINLNLCKYIIINLNLCKYILRISIRNIILIVILLFYTNSLIAEDNQGVRFSFRGGSGQFKLKTNDAINGDFDHDLSGGTFTLSYFALDEDNYFHGGGWSSVNVSADETTSKDKVPGYWTYYNATYGYADGTVTVKSFRTNFFYGIYGYNYEINDKMSLQPNLRYGYKFVVAEWNEKYEFKSTTDPEYKYTETFHTFGLEIVLPFMYKINESFGIGADLCICGSSGEYTEEERVLSRGNKYEFTNVNALNLFFDIYL